MAKKKTVSGKSLNTLDNFEKAHECDCDHNHEENGRRCECCGEEMSFDDYTDCIAENIRQFLGEVTKEQHFTHLELLCGISKAFGLIMDDLFAKSDSKTVEEIYKTSDDIVINMIGKYTEEHNNELDPVAMAFHFNNGSERMINMIQEQIEGRGDTL